MSDFGCVLGFSAVAPRRAAWAAARRSGLARLGSAMLLLAASLASCELLRERPFEALSWSPGTEFVVDTEDIRIGVRFSSAADKASVENAFSLTEDGAKLRGSFSWEGDKELRFHPYAPLRANREYRLTVEAGASDEEGVTLSRALAETFFTRPRGDRPRVLSLEPIDGAVVDDAFAPIRLSFSVPVDAAACRDHIAVSPTPTGSWSVSADGRSAVFSPAKPWTAGEEYQITVSADMADLLRIRSGIEYRSRFTVGTDRVPPRLLRADALDDAGASVRVLSADDGTDQAVNGGWEAPWRLSLLFSEPVALASLDGALISSGGPSVVRETGGESASSVVYRFSQRPAWNTLFALRLASGVKDLHGNESEESALFRVRADGLASRPPRLVGIRFPMVPAGGDEADLELAAFSADEPYAALSIGNSADRYPIGTDTSTFIEVYLETAEGASPSVFSFMEQFRVSATNGALAFSSRNVKTSSFRVPYPHAPWSSYDRVEVEGLLTNRTSSGLVTFLLGTGFCDSSGNATTAELSLPLLK